jgi:hypothetical protein|tara:strand:+ start:4408 stop:4866 length:459 start_codon:yes stop_codon:yes gene_type:complete
MNNYFKILDDLQEAAIAEPFINTVTQGDITEVDLNKNTIFPLCHLMLNNVSLTSNACNLNMSIVLMDIVNFSKEAKTSDIRGNSNELDVLNTQLSVAGRLQALLLRSETYRNNYQLDGAFNCEPFTDRFESNVAGWTVSFSVTMFNESTSVA